MDTITKPLNRRDIAKRATREKALKAARETFSTVDYNAATIRSLAKSMGMSTGAIFAHFSGKADLWRQAMGCEPPVDSALTRAAPALLDALKNIERYVLETKYPSPSTVAGAARAAIGLVTP